MHPPPIDRGMLTSGSTAVAAEDLEHPDPACCAVCSAIIGVADFIACGQYLVDKGYTTTAKLGAVGISMGGVLDANASFSLSGLVV